MRTGVVVIGRNEGTRLATCLRSAAAAGGPIVYVDSRSTDGSAERAASLGAIVRGIPEGQPLSAARGRNIGLDALLGLHPDLDAVQFIDGDCEMIEGWFEAARTELVSRPDVAIVCGRVRERHPDANIYMRMCDLEFDRPPGEVAACGGIFMVRPSVFRSVGGFNPTLPAGEEPEMCRRIRDTGWIILRIGRDMCWHDSAMRSFRHWWRRQFRSGYGGLDVARRFGLPQFRRQCLSARVWTLGIFVLSVTSGGVAFVFMGPGAGVIAAAVMAMLVPFQAFRIGLKFARRGLPMTTAMGAGLMTMVSKWAQVQGQFRLMIERAAGRNARVVEHHPAEPRDGAANGV